MAKHSNLNKHPFMWVAVILACIAILFPLVILVIWCFSTAWPFPELLPTEWSLKAFDTTMKVQAGIPEAIGTSIFVSLSVAVICVLISLLVGHALAFYDFPGKYLVDFLTFLPVIIPMTTFGMGVHIFMLRYGLAGHVSGVILAHVVVLVPYSIKIVTDSLRLLGRNLYEQAWIAGASPLRAFIDVALPPLAPTLVTALSLIFIGSYGLYFLTFLIGGGQVKTLAIILFPWVASSERGVAAVIALIYIATSFGVYILLELVGKLLSRNKKTYLM